MNAGELRFLCLTDAELDGELAIDEGFDDMVGVCVNREENLAG